MRPSAIRPRHLALARGERSSGSLRPVRTSSWVTTSGSSAAPPAATRRSASRNSRDVGDAVLEQVADPAACRRPAGRRRSAPRRTGRASAAPRPATACGSRARRCTPSSVNVGGIRTSTTQTSGWCSLDGAQQRLAVVDRVDDLEAALRRAAARGPRAAARRPRRSRLAWQLHSQGRSRRRAGSNDAGRRRRRGRGRAGR